MHTARLRLSALLLILTSGIPLFAQEILTDSYRITKIETLMSPTAEKLRNSSERSRSILYNVRDEEFYNEQGLLSKKIAYKRDEASVLSTTYYKYNELGQKISYEYYNEKFKMTSKSTYSYTDFGELLESSSYKSSEDFKNDNKYSQTFYEYNDDNLLISKKTVYPDGSVYEYGTYYDDYKHIIKETKINPDGTVKNEMEYEYKGPGLMSKSVKYKWDSNDIDYIDLYDYDDSGILIKQTSCNPDMSVRYDMFYYYDDDGKLVGRKSCLEDGTIRSEEELDKYGSVIKSILYDENGEIKDIKETSYIPDLNGNWTIKIEHKEGYAQFMTTREITYEYF